MPDAENGLRPCQWRSHYGEPCDCENRLAQVVTHTRTSTPLGPDFCAECSEAISEWVSWSVCVRVRRVFSPIDPESGVLAPRCPRCGWQAIDRADTPENYEAAKADVVAHKAGCPGVTPPAENDEVGLDGVEVGSTWKRNPPGREVVRIERVWMYGIDEDYGPTVRAHPTNGGRPIVAPTEWLRDNFTRVTSPGGQP